MPPRSNIRVNRVAVVVALFVAGVMLGGGAAVAVAAPQVSRGSDVVAGRTVKSWSASFVTWQIERAASSPVNPAKDPSDCQQGQGGAVFFIPTSFGGPQTAVCTVPAGTPVFVSPAGWRCDEPPFRLATCPIAAPVGRRIITEVRVAIDGAPVRVLPSDWIMKAGFTVKINGRARPTLLGSYSYVISGLAPGTHTIVLYTRMNFVKFRARMTATVIVQ